MSDDAYEQGLKIRKAVLGEDYVNRALANLNSFNAPLHELVTEYCWGKVWGAPRTESQAAQHAQPVPA